MDLVTPSYKLGAAVAQRLPRGLVEGAPSALAAVWSRLASDKTRMVERHQRRVDPDLRGAELRHRVAEVYRSYGRYWAESFRLAVVSDAEIRERVKVEGYEYFDEAIGAGKGVIIVVPHLGSWEWAALWVSRVHGIPVTAVVEKLEPPELFEWFTELRRKNNVNVIPLDAKAGGHVNRALKAGQAVALLSDRDIAGNGVTVEFFGEKTTLPGGPATLALRSGAPLLPIAVYDQPRGHCRVRVRPPMKVERQGTLRRDVARLTQEIADVLEDQIRSAPEQWHLLQPNWPSDRSPVRL